MFKRALLYLLVPMLEDIKPKVIAALRAHAARTDNKLDDRAVDAVDEMWDVIAGIILGALK